MEQRLWYWELEWKSFQNKKYMNNPKIAHIYICVTVASFDIQNRNEKKVFNIQNMKAMRCCVKTKQ